MANISDLRREVRLYVNQCPDTTIDYAVVRAIRNFCRDTWYYQATIVFDQINGQDAYLLVPSDGTEVIEVSIVELANDSRIYPITQEEITRSTGTVTGFHFEPPNSLQISPVPNTSVTNGIEVRLVLMPPEGTTTFPDGIYRNYKETIIAGALAFILAMQEESWSNPQLAAFKQQEYNLGSFAAKGDRMTDFKPGGLQIKRRPFLI